MLKNFLERRDRQALYVAAAKAAAATATMTTPRAASVATSIHFRSLRLTRTLANGDTTTRGKTVAAYDYAVAGPFVVDFTQKAFRSLRLELKTF